MVNDAKFRSAKRRKGTRHDKTGCVTCRYRHKKCTENTFPVCGACMRLNLECIREPIRNIVPTVRPEIDSSPNPKTPHPSTSLSPVSVFPPTFAGSSSTKSLQHRYAMRYYVSELANHFTVSTQFNSFLSDFLPMAMESPALCDSLLALASSHISLVDQSYAVATLEAQTNAIRNLTSAINTPSDQITWHETNAATCLALATSQISTSDGNGWYAHLQGAKHFITSAAIHPAIHPDSEEDVLRGADAFKVTPEGRWILRNFAYHDIIGSVTLRRRPLMEPSYLSNISDVVDSYIGVATATLSYMGEISSLEDDTALLKCSTIDETNEMVPLHDRCTQIENELGNWTCPLDAETELTSMAYAYRSCVLILLYRLVRKRLGTDHGANLVDLPTLLSTATLESKIATQVDLMLRYISDVPVGAAPEAAFLLPLFIAGGEAREEAHINLIRTRLQQILEKRNFQNISLALEILECLWHRRQIPGSESADWEEILDASGEELVLT